VLKVEKVANPQLYLIFQGKYEFHSIDFVNPVLEVSSSPFLTEEVIKNPFAGL
jgi:hypothetical protein